MRTTAVETWTEVEEGLMATEIAGAATRVMVAVADLVVSASEVARSEICEGLGRVLGAVYVREVVVTLVSAPQASPLQPLPERVQLTPLF